MMHLNILVVQVTQYLIAIGIMYMRIYALWELKRKVLLIIAGALLGASFAGYYLTARFTLSSDLVLNYPELPFFGCQIIYLHQTVWEDEVFLLVCETLSVCLLVAKRMRLSHSPHTLSKMIYTDGILYFICVLATSVFDTVFLFLAPPTTNTSLTILQSSIHSILCNRLLLRLRGAYETMSSRDVSLVTRSTLWFAAPLSPLSQEPIPLQVLSRPAEDLG